MKRSFRSAEGMKKKTKHENEKSVRTYVYLTYYVKDAVKRLGWFEREAHHPSSHLLHKYYMENGKQVLQITVRRCARCGDVDEITKRIILHLSDFGAFLDYITC